VWAVADRTCSLDSAVAELVDRNGVSHVLRAAYALELTGNTHELTFIEPIDEPVDFDWASIIRAGVQCATDAIVSEVGVLAVRGAERWLPRPLHLLDSSEPTLSQRPEFVPQSQSWG
jgi:hypothetical protein